MTMCGMEPWVHWGMGYGNMVVLIHGGYGSLDYGDMVVMDYLGLHGALTIHLLFIQLARLYPHQQGKLTP